MEKPYVDVPSIGDGATMSVGSDRYPGTVIAVSKSGHTVTVQNDDYKRTDSNGYGGQQEYAYTPNPNGGIRVFTLRADGRYHEKGTGMRHGCRVTFGVRNAYYDPHF